jgi:hypothetical protein
MILNSTKICECERGETKLWGLSTKDELIILWHGQVLGIVSLCAETRLAWEQKLDLYVRQKKRWIE